MNVSDRHFLRYIYCIHYPNNYTTFNCFIKNTHKWDTKYEYHHIQTDDEECKRKSVNWYIFNQKKKQ